MITERDREVIETLLHKVRVISEFQIAETWWQGSAEVAARRLGKLAREGWLIGERHFARPLLPLESPLIEWGPAAPAPDYGRLSWHARSRWTLAVVPTPVWHVTPRAAARLGGFARGSIKNRCQLTHDLHVTAIYLRMRELRPDAAALWVGEDHLPQTSFRRFVPDAVLMRGDAVLRAIEFGGAYAPSRFESFHEHCSFRRLPYEIW